MIKGAHTPQKPQNKHPGSSARGRLGFQVDVGAEFDRSWLFLPAWVELGASGGFFFGHTGSLAQIFCDRGAGLF